MMEGIQSDKSHLLLSSATGFDCGKGGKNPLLLSLGMQKTKHSDLIICLQTISQLTGSGFVQQGALKRLFLSKPGSFSNPGASEVPGPKIKAKFIKYQCPGQQNQGRSLDGKQIWPVWNSFHMANACFHAASLPTLAASSHDLRS